ncbi:hypothetical protein [Candidatus Chloroploca sp. Khr17]|uniref:hypothetical protein n=1 Tax=Candidatus Chloroploca sp. Khr17 TaxID=2496869 RepID=UPI00101BC2C1|nr:hypothetical protein [Candidatus Chloroploca sp. Khr17]
MALVVAFAALFGGFFRTPPAPQVIYIPVPQPEPAASGGGCLPLIITALVMLLLLGVIRF